MSDKMIYTDELLAIEDTIDLLCHNIIECDVVKNYVVTKVALLKNAETQQKVTAFEQAKRSFERVEPYGNHAPDYTEKRRALRKQKRLLDTDERIMRFRVAERELQEVLDYISYDIAQSISPDIKVDAGNPFFEFATRGCGGSCHIG